MGRLQGKHRKGVKVREEREEKMREGEYIGGWGERRDIW